MNEAKPSSSHMRRVAILCANNVQVDSRVRKIGRSAKGLGFDPLIIGISRSQGFEDTEFDGIRTLLVDNSAQRFRHFSASHLNAFPWSLLAYRSNDQVEFNNLNLMSEHCSIAGTDGHASWFRVNKYKINLIIYTIRRLATRREYLVYVKPNKVRYTLRRWRLKLSAGSRWAYYEPTLLDFSALMIPELEKFSPDVIHANDTATIVAALAYKRNFPNTKIIYDVHEWVHGLPGLDPLKADVYGAVQDRYIHCFDEVITVSSALADLIRNKYEIDPKVVENFPWASSDKKVTSIRSLLRIDKSVPILVYSGWLAPERGIGTVLRALVKLDSCEFVIVTNQDNQAKEVIEAARTLGVSNRLHILPYVNPDEIIEYLSSCDIGLIPLDHAPNHEISRITKFFEYAHARLPIVCSDLKIMSDSIYELGIGNVFEAGNTDSLVEAVKITLDNADEIRTRYTDDLLDGMTWNVNFQTLKDSYNEK